MFRNKGSKIKFKKKRPGVKFSFLAGEKKALKPELRSVQIGDLSSNTPKPVGEETQPLGSPSSEPHAERIAPRTGEKPLCWG